MERRRFIESMVVGGIALPASMSSLTGASGPIPSERHMNGSETRPCITQHLHADAQTDPPDVEYYFLGNGRITAVLQHAWGRAAACGLTPLGLMIWDPHQFSRKWNTFTFHPEWGLARGNLVVHTGDDAFRPQADAVTVERDDAEGFPAVIARWNAGELRVEERYWVDADEPLLIREVTVRAPAGRLVEAVSTALYYSHVLFVDYRSDAAAGTLRADGYAHMELFADPDPVLSDRFMRVIPEETPDGARVTFQYVIRQRREDLRNRALDRRREAAAAYWRQHTTIRTTEPRLDSLLRAAQTGIRATVADSGRYDASVWQYNMEWVIDASAVAMAATQSGMWDVASAMLENMVTRLSNERGIMAHASRFREDLETELNQQGMILSALWTHWSWSGDASLVRRHWDQIRRIADFPLQPPYLHESGLLYAAVELFERTEGMGVQPGFELAHQTTVAWGLQRAAVLADVVGDGEAAGRWREASERMEHAMLNHPRYAFVEDGVIIKRRLPDGSRQEYLRPAEVGTEHVPHGMPLAEEEFPLLDPDVGAVFPILFGQIDPEGPLARRTLEEMRTLWDAEGQGGYLRYHPSGDPDSPGGWTFPTAFLGRAFAEAGDAAEVRRILDWFLSVQGGRAGSFFEFYALRQRPVPPLPPMGIIVWGWAEIATLFIGHLLGARPTEDGSTLAFRPLLPEGIDEMNGSVRYRDGLIDVTIRRDPGRPRAAFNGRTQPIERRYFELPEPPAHGDRLEIWI